MTLNLFKSEGVVLRLSLVIIGACLVALMARLLILVGGETPARALVFAPASIAYMITGLFMVIWRIMFVTLAIAFCCVVASISRARKSEWSRWTAVAALVALVGHAAYLLYP